MKTNSLVISLLFIFFMILSCEKDKNIDTEKPAIDVSSISGFPNNCDTIYFGESFDLKMLFRDNVALGSYSIDIHNNFDHHSHSTEVTECTIGASQYPVNPFAFINDYDIPAGEKEYRTNLSILIPSGNEIGLYDDGDYHFFISLTDKEGWSVQKGLNIKMLHR